jgi:uncharacterized protein YueI
MPGPDVEDYLKQGMYGSKVTKPDERRKFLGTLRERVIIALTREQVKEDEIYKEVEDAVKNHPKAKLLLNGNLDYSYLSKYTKLSNEHQVEYTIVSNKEYDSEFGLVLADEKAIDKEDIFVTKREEAHEKNSDKEPKNKKGILSILDNVFKK